MTVRPENWMTEPVGNLIIPAEDHDGYSTVPVYVNPDGVLSLRPWREVPETAGGSGPTTTEPPAPGWERWRMSPEQEARLAAAANSLSADLTERFITGLEKITEEPPDAAV